MREFPYYYITCHKPIKKYSANDSEDIREMFDEVIKECDFRNVEIYRISRGNI